MKQKKNKHFVDKKLLFTDIFAYKYYLVYDFIIKKNINVKERGRCMRHFYFRLVLGSVFVICMIYSLIKADIPFALMYLVLGAIFLYSSYSLWKKDKDNRR